MKNNQLELVTKIAHLERTTGVSIFKEIPKVPPKNLIVALQNINIKDLADMVLDNPIQKVVAGLQVITPKQIKEVDVEKLKVVLKYGDMNTIAKLQTQFKDDDIIIALQNLSKDKLIEILIENDYDKMITVVFNLR